MNWFNPSLQRPKVYSNDRNVFRDREEVWFGARWRLRRTVQSSRLFIKILFFLLLLTGTLFLPIETETRVLIVVCALILLFHEQIRESKIATYIVIFLLSSYVIFNTETFSSLIDEDLLVKLKTSVWTTLGFESALEDLELEKSTTSNPIESYIDARELFGRGQCGKALARAEDFKKLVTGEHLSDMEKVLALDLLGSVYCCSGRYSEAIEMIDQSLKLKHQTFEKERYFLTIALGYNAMATTKLDSGSYTEEVVELFHKALDYCAQDMNNTGAFAGKTKILSMLDTTQALLSGAPRRIEMIKEAHQVDPRALMLHIWDNIADYLIFEKKYSEAEVVLPVILELKKSYIGEYHMEIVSTSTRLARLYTNLNDVEKALEYVQKAKDLIAIQIRDEIPELAKVNMVYGDVQLAKGEVDEAIETYRKCEEFYQNVQDTVNFDVLLVKVKLGGIYYEKEEFSYAQDLYQEALKILEEMGIEGEHYHADKIAVVQERLQVLSEKRFTILFQRLENRLSDIVIDIFNQLLNFIQILQSLGEIISSVVGLFGG